MARIMVIHGPNLNMLGKREPDVYGAVDYDALNKEIMRQAQQLGHQAQIHQSNHEGELVDLIQGCVGNTDVVVINPGAYTHTSVAIRDALLAVGLPVIEAHMSNVHKREPFRQQSYISDISAGVITGFGAQSYYMAIAAVESVLSGE